MGLLELVTGLRFSELSRRWDALPSWQRASLAFAVGALAVVAMLAFATLVGVLLSR